MNSLTRHCSLAPLRTPPIHRSMRTLDRTQFAKVIPCLALKVPAPKANTAMKALGPYLLNWPRMKNLVGEGKERLVLLDAAPETGEIQGLESVLETALAGVPVEKTKFDVKVGYEYWTADEILKAVLPEDLEVITAFETIGDIAHMNLRDHVLPYKHLIGQVILDKTARLTTVVNKTSSIHTQFRTFPLELLASRNPAHTPTDLETTLSENGCQYHLNFATVYWNSRLHTEHHRLVAKYFSPGDLVADAMCGIGPFALPAAKNKGCAVVANDLNPESYRWLVKNVEVNGLAGAAAAATSKEGDRPPAGYVKPVNECGRDFIRTSTACLAPLLASEIVPTFTRMAAAEQGRADAKQAKGKEPAAHVALVKQYEASVAKWTDAGVPVHVFAHYVMNLPASALGFLDGFHGMWADWAQHRAYLRTVRPLVHVYYFTRAGFVGRGEGESEEHAIHRDAKARIGYVMGAEPEELEVHRVRLVAPRKDMCCASFRVPEGVLFGETVGGDVKVELEYDLHEEEVRRALVARSGGGARSRVKVRQKVGPKGQRRPKWMASEARCEGVSNHVHFSFQ